MSKAIAVGTANGKYELEQSEIKEFIRNLFAGSDIDIERMISVFDNSNVTNRFISVPVEWLRVNHTFRERNELYVTNAIELCIKAINECLNIVNAERKDIDHIIFVSSTGLSTPSIDALLINELKFNTHIKRTPIWGLGCMGGSAGLSRAMEYAKTFPKENVLLVALELCSLTFRKDDVSKSNIVACSLFSDGCAAVLVAGDESPYASHKGIKYLDSMSTIYYDSLDVMGWEIMDDGFKVIFSRDIPTIVKEYVKPNISELLDKHQLHVEDIKHYIAHPGGLKVLNAYEESLGLESGRLSMSRKILKGHGNMSSASVLYVLEEFLDENKYRHGEYGLVTSLGPGFSSELVLFMTL